MEPTNNFVYGCLDAFITAKGKTVRQWDKKQLFNYIRSIAPYGMMDMYEFFDATPDEMSLDLPSPDNDMFYGIITNPGGTDGMTNTGSYVYLTATFEYNGAVVVNTGVLDAGNDAPPNATWQVGDRFVITTGDASQSTDPTWTKGDKLEMTWTINPPVTTTVT